MKKQIRKVRNTLLRNSKGIQRIIRSLTTTGFIPKRIWKYIQPIGVFDLKVRSDRFLYLSSENDYLSRSIIWTNFKDWENTTIPAFHKIAKESKHFVDIGAYTGVYTLVACSANTNLKAVSFEPNHNIFKNLQENIDLNSFHHRVTCLNMGVSAENANYYLSIPAADETAARVHKDPTEKAVNIKVVKLDDALSGFNVDLVKIDVEGGELDVISGMKEIIKSQKPVLFVECLSKESFITLQKTLCQFGYAIYYYCSKYGVIRFPEFSKIKRESGYPNFIFSSSSLDHLLLE